MISKRPFLEMEFQEKKMEDSYNKFQAGSEKDLLNLSNILLSPIIVFFLYLGFLYEVPLIMMLTRTMSLALLIVAYLSRKKKSSIIQKLCISFVVFAITFGSIRNISKISLNNLQAAFMVGNAVGAIELNLALAIKDMRQRIIINLVLMVSKMLALSDNFENRTKTLSISPIIFFTIISFFYVYAHIQDRKIFKIIYESRDKLSKFQDLLSNDFPLSVSIVSQNTQEILYANEFFKNSFNCQDTTVKIFDKFLLDLSSLRNYKQEHKEEVSLFDYLYNKPKFQEFQPQVINLAATFKADKNTEYHYEIKLRKIVWDKKESYAMVFNDVSDKQMIVALKMADEQKDRVIATVSHELRTPINGILGLIEMITVRVTDSVALTYLDYCKNCSKLLLYLVNSILDLSQIRHNKIKILKEYFNLNGFLEEVKSLYLFHSQQKGIDFLTEVDPEVPRNIYSDKYRVMGILINLLSNAMKFTFQGYVLLKVFLEKNDRKKVVFMIEDTGIGIREDNKSSLFKMFGKIEQSDKNINVQGVGLGLTIANEIVKVLSENLNKEKDKIEFESEFGKGSKFWFKIDVFPLLLTNNSILLENSLEVPAELSIDHGQTSHSTFKGINKKIMPYNKSIFHKKSDKKNFKLNTEQDPSRQQAMQTIKLVAIPNKHALIVDDVPLNLTAASFILGQLGFQTTKALNGKECIDLLEKGLNSSLKYSFILTDIQMPILDGLEMSKLITEKINKKEIYSLPIIAITAKKLDDSEKEMYKQNGICYALEKPLIKDQIKTILENLGLLS